MVIGEDSGQSKDLWMHAYEILKSRDPSLVIAYERYLASVIDSQAARAQVPLNPDTINTIIKQKLQVVRLGAKSIKLRAQGEKVIKFIL